MQLNANVLDRRRTSEDTTELIRRLAQHYPDRQIAQVLSRQGRLTASGLPFTQSRVYNVRVKAAIPAAPPPDPASQLFSILQAAGELGVSTNTIHRWLRQGLLPGELRAVQVTQGRRKGLRIEAASAQLDRMINQ